MLTTLEAIDAINAAMPDFDTEQVALGEATSRVLRQGVFSERDQPPFNRVTMDGVALQFDEFEGGRRSFGIQGTQQAGDRVTQLTEADNCIEVMTGAVMPERTDCVVPVERLSVSASAIEIEADYVARRNQFVHARGSDHVAGTEVLSTGDVIGPTEIAIIASCGLETVAVGRSPRVQVVSTGNELVAPGSPIEHHQVRMSNGPALVAMLKSQGFRDCEHDHLADDTTLLRTGLDRYLANSDVLVLSGGVSMGKADFVPQVLEDLGVKLVFHKISQRPGKPMWFGIGPQDQAVFALPGNPVSAVVCCRQYVLPSLFRASGRTSAPVEYIELGDDVEFRPKLTCFLPIRLETSAQGTTVAMPVPTNTSGDFTSLGGTDGYVELERDVSDFASGETVPLHRWHRP